MNFTPEQTAQLEAKLDQSRVQKNAKGFDHLEGWEVIHVANEIFGFDGWCSETKEMEFLHQPLKNANGNTCVSYRALVRITIGDVWKEGTGFGNGWAKQETDSHESALKEAETDAIKRAFRLFGNQFGLALYDKSKENVASPEDIATESYLTLIRSGNWGKREDAVAWTTQEQTHKEWRESGLLRKHVNAIHAAIDEHYPDQEAA